MNSPLQLAPVYAAVLAVLFLQPLVRSFEVSVAQETSVRAERGGMLSCQKRTARQKMFCKRPYGRVRIWQLTALVKIRCFFYIEEPEDQAKKKSISKPVLLRKISHVT